MRQGQTDEIQLLKDKTYLRALLLPSPKLLPESATSAFV